MTPVFLNSSTFNFRIGASIGVDNGRLMFVDRFGIFRSLDANSGAFLPIPFIRLNDGDVGNFFGSQLDLENDDLLIKGDFNALQIGGGSTGFFINRGGIATLDIQTNIFQ